MHRAPLLGFLLLLILATSGQAQSVILTWDPVVHPDLSGYQLLRCQAVPPATTCTPVDLPGATTTTTITTYTDTAVAPGLTYVYSVVALCSTCPAPRSLPSNLLVVRVGAPPVPPPTLSAVALVVPPSTVVATADSQSAGYEAALARDEQPGTFWHTEWLGTQPGHPHRLTLDLGRFWWVQGLRYQPRQDGFVVGTIAQYRVMVSQDGQTWTPSTQGTWPLSGPGWREARWAGPLLARYVRLVSVSAAAGQPYASAAEVQVLAGEAP